MKTNKKLASLFGLLFLFISINFYGQCTLQPYYTDDLNRPYFTTNAVNWGNMVTDVNGNVYAVFANFPSVSNSASLVVRKYNGATWSFLGGDSVASSSNGFSYSSIALDNLGTPYVACTELTNNKTQVFKYNGSNWSVVGAIDFSSSSATNVVMAIDGNNTPYVAFCDGSVSYKTTVMKYDGTNWVMVGSAGFSAGNVNYLNIAIDKNNAPYVAYTDQANSNKATVMKFDGTSWNALGGSGFTSSTANGISLAINSSNQPYVLYTDGANSSKATVQMYNGSAWQLVGTAGISSAGINSSGSKIALNSLDVPYISYILTSTKKYSVMQFSGGTWNFVGSSNISACQSLNYSTDCLSFDNLNNPYLGYVDNKYLTAPVVQKFNGSTWQFLGTTGVTNFSSNYIDIAVDQTGTTYIAAADLLNGNKLNVYKNVSGNWVQVGSSNFTSGQSINVDLEVSSSGILYVAYQDGATSNKLTVQQFNGSSWSIIGTAGISTGLVAALDLTLDKNEAPCVAYSDNNTSFMASVKKWDGTSWNLIGTTSFVGVYNSAGNISLAFDSANNPYISYADPNNAYLGVYKFSGGTWSSVPLTGITQVSISSPVIMLDKNDNIYVAYADATNNSATTIKYVAGTWSYVGSSSVLSGYNYSVTSLNLVMDVNTNLPVITFFDSNSEKAAIWAYNGANWYEKFGGIGSGAVSYATAVADNTGSVYLLLAEGGLYIYKTSLTGTSSTISANSACIGSTVTINASGGTNYNLSGPYSSTVATNTITPVALANAGTYTMVVSQTGCGGVIYTHSLTVNNLPIITANATSTVVCQGSSVTLNGVGATSYTWSNGINNGVAFTPTVSATYTVIGTDANGCSNTITKVITVNNLPIITANATSTVVCQGSSVTLNGAGAISYTWNNGVSDGIAYTPAATTTYTVVGTDANGCSNSATKVIAVNSLPVVTANSTANGVCTGSSITLSGGGASTYTWSSGVNNGISFIPPATATYTVTGTDVNGCINTATKNIIVNNLPNVTANATATVVCQGTGVTLTGGGASTYTWSGTVIDGVVFTPAGSVTYTVTGTDINGCINTSTKTITVNNLPTVTANATATVICQGSNVTLSGSGANTYSWTNGVINGAAFTPIGTATYSVTGMDANGCVNTAIKTITVNTLPAVLSNATATVVCLGTNVTLTGTGANTYTWANNVTDGAAFTPTSTATYTLVGTDVNGCSNTTTRTIIVNTLPVVTATTTGSSICYGNATTLNGGGATSYIWTNGVTNGVSFTPLSTTTYTVIGTDTNGCTNTATKTIIVNSLPTIIIQASDTTICNGNSLTLTANGATSYAWNNGVMNGVSFIPSSTLLYTVIGTDNNGCVGTNSKTITVNTLPSIGNLNTTNSLCGSSNGSATVSVSGGQMPYNYSWSNGDITNTASNLAPGQYQLQVIDAKGCKSFLVVNINATNGPSISVVANSSVTCYGGNNGFASINISGGTQPYKTLWSNGFNALSIGNLVAGPYDVTVTDTNNCSTSQSINIVQPQAITTNFGVSPSQCASATGSATANSTGGAGSYTYTWDANAANQTTSTANNLAAGVYHVIITDANNCVVTEVVTITNSATTLTGTIGSVTAGNCGTNPTGSAIMYASNGVGTYTYLWSNGTTKDTISNLQPGTYYCTVTDANLCSFTQSITIPSSIDGLQQNLCLVTVDTNTMTNKIVWEKTITHDIKAFKIYRESSVQNVYTTIATLLYNNLSEYTDSIANPAIHAWRYKITAVDSCNNETPYSAAHKTIHLSQNLGVGGEINLLWDQYEGFNYYTYYIWRYDQSTNWMLIDSVSTNNTSYTDFTPPSTSARYMIEIIPPAPCNSTYRMYNSGSNQVQTAVVKSRSNIKTQRVSAPNGINKIITSSLNFTLFPNPNTGDFTLLINTNEFNYKAIKAIIYNTLGEEVLIKNITVGENKLKIPDVNNSGIYYLSITNADGKAIGKQIIIKQ